MALKARIQDITKGKSLDFWLISVFTLGIIIFNINFTGLHFQNLYLEYAAIILFVFTAVINVFSGTKMQEKLRDLGSSNKAILLLLPLLIILGIGTLITGAGRGFLALQQSMILLYGILFFIFILAFTSRDRLIFALALFIFIGANINGIKLILFRFLDLSYYGESFRVLHNEVDVIAASLALIALLIFRNKLLEKSRPLFFITLALNLAAILLSVKRTAIIGLAVIVTIYLVMIRRSITAKHIRNFGISVAVLALAGGLFFLINREIFNNLLGFFVEKIHIFDEGNAAWRWKAWDLALDLFKESPITGIGYGKHIIQIYIEGVLENHPHNSFLSVFVHHGIIGGLAFTAMCIITFVKYIRFYMNTKEGTTKKLTLLLFFFYIFMIIFAMFNVVLENMHQAIFFWFAFSGIYILQSIQKPTDSVTLNPITLTAAIAAVVFFSALLVSPLNKMERIDIYSPVNGGRVPMTFHEKDTKRLELANTDHGLDVWATGLEKSWSYLAWVFPQDVNSLEKNIDKYAIEISFNQAPPTQMQLMVRETGSKLALLNNPSPGQKKLTIPFSYLTRNYDFTWQRKIYFGLYFSKNMEDYAFTITEMTIVEAPLKTAVLNPLYDKTIGSQIPLIHNPDKMARVQADHTENGLSLSSKTETDSWVAFNWLLPASYKELQGNEATYAIQVRFTNPLDSEIRFSFSTDDFKTPFYVDNLFPGSPVAVLPLQALSKNKEFDWDDIEYFAINLPQSEHEISLEIETISLVKENDSPYFQEGVYPLYMAEINGTIPRIVFDENTKSVDVAPVPEGLQVISDKTAEAWAVLNWNIENYVFPMAEDNGHYAEIHIKNPPNEALGFDIQRKTGDTVYLETIHTADENGSLYRIPLYTLYDDGVLKWDDLLYFRLILPFGDNRPFIIASANIKAGYHGLLADEYPHSMGIFIPDDITTHPSLTKDDILPEPKIERNNDSMVIESVTTTSGWSAFYWYIGDKTYNLGKHLQYFTIDIETENPLPKDCSISLYASGGESYIYTLKAESSKLSIPLTAISRKHGLFWETINGFSLNLPYEAHNETIVLKSVRLGGY